MNEKRYPEDLEGRQDQEVSEPGRADRLQRKVCMERGQRAVYITERAVFENTADGLMLTEVAPGVDLEKDIFAHMEFKPVISPDLKLMDRGLFEPVWGGLRDALEGSAESGEEKLRAVGRG